MMSTRRTTRATSKAASSRGPSPSVISEGDIPATPARRSSRHAASTTPLPPIASRASAAYGTNTVAQPGSLRVPEAGEDAENVIDDLLTNPSGLAAVREEDTPSDTSDSPGARAARPKAQIGSRVGRRPASSMPAPDVSFNNESGVFGGVGLESSSVSFTEVSGRRNVPQPPTKNRRPTKQERERQEQQARLREIARTQVVERLPVEDPTPTSAEIWTQWFYEKGDQALDLLTKFIRVMFTLWAWVKTPLGFFVASLTLSTALTLLFRGFSSSTGSLDSPGSSDASESIRWFGAYDIRHNVGQFVPNVVAHPFRLLNPDALQNLQRQMDNFDYEIAYLKKRSDLDANSISHLEAILPSNILVKKDKRGNMEITHDFWLALDSKMRAENVYLQDEFTGKPSKDSSTTDLSVTQLEAVMDKSQLWEKYLLKHRKTLDERSREEFNYRFPDKIKEFINPSTVVPRSEFIQMFRQHWEDTQKEIKAEIRKLSKDLDGFTKEQIQAISTDVFKKQLYNTQLQGVARAHLNLDVAQSFKRVNHFSQGTGATVNPKLTSPNYLFPTMDQNVFVRGLSSLLYKPIPRPNPPEVALQRWEEYGDCWCAPAVDSAGFGPSLAVIMGNYIYPDLILVEHVPQSGTLEPGSAPKEMEMLALIEDEEIYWGVKRLSDYTFQEETPDGEQQPYGFVRIARWTYDAKSVDNLQSFVPQVDLSKFKGRAQTNRLIVRSKNNWSDGRVDYTCLYRVRVNGEIAPKHLL